MKLQNSNNLFQPLYLVFSFQLTNILNKNEEILLPSLCNLLSKMLLYHILPDQSKFLLIKILNQKIYIHLKINQLKHRLVKCSLCHLDCHFHYFVMTISIQQPILSSVSVHECYIDDNI